jgi:uncharacterized protein YbjT (DUF2867 family)
MAERELFLVTGAGAGHGATGNGVVRQLLQRKLPVRAFVHRDDARASELKALGAEIVVGDLRDIEIVRRAMRGARRAYFLYPIREGLLEASTIFAIAAKEAGVESIVNMSQISARADHLSPAARQHWLSERVFDWSGVGMTHLRPTFFLENLLSFTAETIRTESKIYLPFGKGQHAPVGGEDIARMVVGVLLDPAPHRGKTYIPTGAKSFSMAGMAEVFSRVLGRPIQYADIPVEKWRQILSRNPTFTTHFIEHLARVAEAHQRGEFDGVTEVVQTIGGAPPKALDQFIRENRAAFGG